MRPKLRHTKKCVEPISGTKWFLSCLNDLGSPQHPENLFTLRLEAWTSIISHEVLRWGPREETSLKVRDEPGSWASSLGCSYLVVI